MDPFLSTHAILFFTLALHASSCIGRLDRPKVQYPPRDKNVTVSMYFGGSKLYKNKLSLSGFLRHKWNQVWQPHDVPPEYLQTNIPAGPTIQEPDTFFPGVDYKFTGNRNLKAVNNAPESGFTMVLSKELQMSIDCAPIIGDILHERNPGKYNCSQQLILESYAYSMEQVQYQLGWNYGSGISFDPVDDLLGIYATEATVVLSTGNYSRFAFTFEVRTYLTSEILIYKIKEML